MNASTPRKTTQVALSILALALTLIPGVSLAVEDEWSSVVIDTAQRVQKAVLTYDDNTRGLAVGRDRVVRTLARREEAHKRATSALDACERAGGDCTNARLDMHEAAVARAEGVRELIVQDRAQLEGVRRLAEDVLASTTPALRQLGRMGAGPAPGDTRRPSAEAKKLMRQIWDRNVGGLIDQLKGSALVSWNDEVRIALADNLHRAQSAHATGVQAQRETRGKTLAELQAAHDTAKALLATAEQGLKSLDADLYILRLTGDLNNLQMGLNALGGAGQEVHEAMDSVVTRVIDQQNLRRHHIEALSPGGASPKPRHSPLDSVRQRHR